MARRPVEVATLVSVVDDRRARDDLRRYFATRADGSFQYTGARFDTLGRDYDNHDKITATDIVAVQTLSVVVPGQVAIDLLEGPLGHGLSRLLQKVPHDVELGTSAAAEHVRDKGPADKAWRLLDACHGVGWVIAGKILARKRPKLLPIYDGVVKCAFGSPKSFWQYLDERLQEDGGLLRAAISRLRRDTGTPSAISDIRMLDIVLWMRHRPGHTTYRCQGLRSAP